MKVDWSKIMGFNRLLMSDVEMGLFQDIKASDSIMLLFTYIISKKYLVRPLLKQCKLIQSLQVSIMCMRLEFL